MGWLKLEAVVSDLPEVECRALVDQVQAAARAWVAAPPEATTPTDLSQVRWLYEKTRSHESPQQQLDRVWLALMLYNLGQRGLAFDAEGRINWPGGVAGRPGIGPDEALALLRQPESGRQVYTASYRHPDGTVTRGKGRRRWTVYRQTLDEAAAPVLNRANEPVKQKVALIVASETYATQPQLPRDFYGGDAFQQACIDAQDRQFDHILVVSPQHGVITLDDMVPSDIAWKDLARKGLWEWQNRAIHRLGAYLLDMHRQYPRLLEDISAWGLLNPDSLYELTLYGESLAVRRMLNYLEQLQFQFYEMPRILIAERRSGYDVGDYDPDDYLSDDQDFLFGFAGDEPLSEEDFYAQAVEDITELFELATDFVSMVNLYVPPLNETWEIAPDEALIPMRLLSDSGIDMDELLDLLSDLSLLLENSVPFTLLLNGMMMVSLLLQITHSVIHSEADRLREAINLIEENALRQYIEKTLQETNQEDRLCGCLTLIEQLHLLSMAVPSHVGEQLLVWVQTYISGRIRPRVMNGDLKPPQP